MNDYTSSVVKIFKGNAKRNPESIAFKEGRNEFSYSAIEKHAKDLAAAFQKLGIETGDRVGFLSRNCVEFFVALYASRMLGAVFLPINFRLSQDEINYILENSQAKLILVDHDLVAQVVSTTARVLPFSAGSGKIVNHVDATSDEVWQKDQNVNSESLLLLYTSGTTGKPKGVIVNEVNYESMISHFPQVPGFAFKAGSIVASTMPLFHIAGINVCMAALSQGCTVLLYSNFNVDKILHDISFYTINYAFLAPAMIVDIVNNSAAENYDFSSLQCIAYGASTIPSVVLRRARKLLSCEFSQLYGMTESTGAGTYLSPSAHSIPEKNGSCGVAWPQMQLKVVCPKGRTLSAGKVGELCMKGPYITPGYFNNNSETALSIIDGWLHTGDVAVIDSEGYVFIKDRIKDLIISGGENISPVEVENAIAACPGVIDVAVIGVPSEKWGEEVKAVVIRESGIPLTENEVIAWTKKHIASYKAPKSVRFTDIIPRNAAGKILRRKLRDMDS